MRELVKEVQGRSCNEGSDNGEMEGGSPRLGKVGKVGQGMKVPHFFDSIIFNNPQERS